MTRHELYRSYLITSEVAKHLRCSVRTIHELTLTSSIPHRRLPGTRRRLFRIDALGAWENGAPLEVTELPRGGRVVVPRTGAPGQLGDAMLRSVR